MRTVGAASESDAIEKNRLAIQSSGAPPARRMINIPRIVAVDLARGKTEGLSVGNQLAMLPNFLPGGGHLPAVVFTYENQRQRPDAGDVHGFMKIARAQCSVAKESQTHGALPFQLHRQGQTRSHHSAPRTKRWNHRVPLFHREARADGYGFLAAAGKYLRRHLAFVLPTNARFFE